MNNRRTLNDISHEIGCDRGAVIRSMKRYGLTNIGEIRFPQLYDKKWFEQELKTKSFRQMAEESRSSVENLGYRARKLGLSLADTKSEEIKASLNKKYPNGRFGEQSSNWQGGRWANRKYIRVYAPEHPNNVQGSVFEHTLVAEKKIERHITKD